MASSVTVLTWGLLRYNDAYVAAGEIKNMLDSIKWPLDYFMKAHVSKFELYVQVRRYFQFCYKVSFLVFKKMLHICLLTAILKKKNDHLLRTDSGFKFHIVLTRNIYSVFHYLRFDLKRTLQLKIKGMK